MKLIDVLLYVNKSYYMWKLTCGAYYMCQTHMQQGFTCSGLQTVQANHVTRQLLCSLLFPSYSPGNCVHAHTTRTMSNSILYHFTEICRRMRCLGVMWEVLLSWL